MSALRYLTRPWTLAVLVLLVTFGIVVSASMPLPVDALGKPELRRALLGTVRVAVPIEKEKDSYSTGSGTVLTSDGYILTNFHVMGDDTSGKLFNSKGLALIAVNPTDLKSLPTWMYQAVLVKADAKLDLAVLKVVATFKGGALPKSLGLTAVPLGDADLVEIGDAIHVIGFPGIGGDSVTFTSGTVAGFLDDDGDRKMDWLKTDAEVNHGNSGGLAVNDAGEMIGVPTAGVTDPEASGKISLIRPINRSLALIKAAVVQGGSTGGDSPVLTPGTSSTPGTTGARIAKLVFTDKVDASNRAAGTITTAFPTGTVEIFAVFEYAGFRNGQKLEATWNRDGKRDVVSTLDWDAGASGVYWVSINNQRGIIAGAYELVITLDGVQLHSARLTVGAAATPARTASGGFTAPIFAEGVTSSNEPVKPHGSTEGFEAGIDRLYAFSNYQNMPSGQSWSHIWYIDGDQVLRRDNGWQWGAKGTFWVNISNKSGLPNGRYRLELYIGDNLVAQSETTVGAGGSVLATSATVQVIGHIIDADTQRPIKGAMFLALKPGVTAEDFLDNPKDADVLGGGETDTKGQFVLEIELARGQTYSIVAAARNYQPTWDDEFTIEEDDESPLEIEIELQKR